MVAEFTIETFDPSQWRAYRDVRLRALKDSPDAFASTFARESAFSDSEWRDRLAGVSREYALPLCASVDGDIAGLASVRIFQPDDSRAHVFQMWVAPEFRGRGIGRGLLDAALDWARARGVDAVVLDVTVGDTPARKLYESAGFVSMGELEPLRTGSALKVETMIYCMTQ